MRGPPPLPDAAPPGPHARAPNSTAPRSTTGWPAPRQGLARTWPGSGRSAPQASQGGTRAKSKTSHFSRAADAPTLNDTHHSPTSQTFCDSHVMGISEMLSLGLEERQRTVVAGRGALVQRGPHLSRHPGSASFCWTFLVPARWYEMLGHDTAEERSRSRRASHSCFRDHAPTREDQQQPGAFPLLPGRKCKRS